MIKRDDDHDNEGGDVSGILSKLPHIITAIIAVGGLIAAYFVTIGDFKIKDIELTHKIEVIETRMTILDGKLTEIQKSLDNHDHSVYPYEERQQLKEDIKSLRDLLLQAKNLLRKGG